MDPPAPNCGSNLTSDSGFLSVPAEDAGSGGRFCQWLVTAPGGSAVDLQIDDFEVCLSVLCAAKNSQSVVPAPVLPELPDLGGEKGAKSW